MATQWHKTSYRGVRFRKHPTRKHGVQQDRYYVVTYKLDGTTKSEAVGWASEGVKPSEVFEDLCKIKNNRKRGQGPVTFAEKRDKEKKNRQRKSNQKITLDQYWPGYLESRKQDKNFSSWDKEESHYIHWLSPLLGSVPLKDLNMESWDKLISALSKKSERTKEYITGTLRRILKHAKTREIINFDPPSPKAIGVTGPGSKNRRERVINPNEAKSIINELAKIDENAWRITRFVFLTGCRASETFHLRWRDIDYVRGTLTFAETKNQDSRELALSKPLQKLLAEITEGELEDYVFLRHDGKPYTEAPRSFRKVVFGLGLNKGRRVQDHITYHSIRHSVATELVNHLNLRDFMDIMGWRTVEMAMRYVHGDKEAKRNALARLEYNMKTHQKGTPDMKEATK